MKKSTKSIIVVILAAVLGYLGYTKFYCNNENCEENCENKDSVTVAVPAVDTTVKAETTTTVAATDSTKK